jgi:hypothetical protein
MTRLGPAASVLGTLGREHAIDGGCELDVAIADQEARPQAELRAQLLETGENR